MYPQDYRVSRRGIVSKIIQVGERWRKSPSVETTNKKTRGAAE